MPSPSAPAGPGNACEFGAVELKMNYRCKSGDLALVLYDEPCCSENIGKVVEVRGPVQRNSWLKLMCWLIKPINRQLWHCVRRTGEHYTAYVTWTRQLEHPDAWLLPLRPDAGGESIEEALEKARSIGVGHRKVLELGLSVNEA